MKKRKHHLKAWNGKTPQPVNKNLQRVLDNEQTAADENILPVSEKPTGGISDEGMAILEQYMDSKKDDQLLMDALAGNLNANDFTKAVTGQPLDGMKLNLPELPPLVDLSGEITGVESGIMKNAGKDSLGKLIVTTMGVKLKPAKSLDVTHSPALIRQMGDYAKQYKKKHRRASVAEVTKAVAIKFKIEIY